MAGMNFCIGMNLGATAAITVGLVGDMHATQLHGLVPIAATRSFVSTSYSSKSRAQTADNQVVRPPLAIRDTSTARSAAELDQGLSASAEVLASARLRSNESGRLDTNVENFRDTSAPETELA